MSRRPTNNADGRADPARAWRRVAVIMRLTGMWAALMWIVWCFPYSRAYGPGIRTSYGIMRWQEVTASHEQVGIASLLPLQTIGARSFRPAAITFSALIGLGSAALIVSATARAMRNLTPRWKCQKCGYVVSSGHPRSIVCSECGELPNLRRDLWAFWT
jgi:hypothetical protein